VLTVAVLATVLAGCGTATDPRLAAIGRSLRTFPGSVIVAKNGKVVLAKGDTERRYNIASVGKTFTGVAVAQLVEAGKLRFDAPIGRYAPELPRTIAPLTIRQLLTHTSGLGDFFSDPRYPALRPTLRSVESYLPLVVHQRAAFRPGTRFLYSNAGYILLGLAIERASGEDYFAYVRDHVFRPAGMDRTELRPGLGSPAGGAYSTTSDLLRFANALFSHRLLSATMTRVVTSAKVAAPGGGYGYGFGIRTGRPGDPPTVWHNGGAPGVGAELDVNPALGWTVIVLARRGYPEIAPTIDSVLNRLGVP
jgi:CubicO group peptidase (beta-lactamase class C family)